MFTTNNDSYATEHGVCTPTQLNRRRLLMSELTVTDLAVNKLKEYLAQNNIDSALRVALMQGG